MSLRQDVPLSPAQPFYGPRGRRDTPLLEARRFYAVEQVRAGGVKVRDLASLLKVAPQSINRWLRAKNLHATKGTGRPRGPTSPRLEQITRARTDRHNEGGTEMADLFK